MKKIVYLFLSVVLALTAVLPSMAFAEETTAVESSDESYKTSDIYLFLQSFLYPENENACLIRSGVTNELKAATWLAERFSELCGGMEIEPTPMLEGNTIYGYNLEVRLKGTSSVKQVIVGAHIDSIGEGANDNASGIAAMYFIMKNIVQNYATIQKIDGEVTLTTSLPFDLVFVAFGMEESGLLGSSYYVSNMTSSERQNTMVMFNLDSIGGGDNLYVFCENKQTDLADFILSNATGSLIEKPYAQGVFGNMDEFGYGYYEKIQGSDHTYFRLNDIPTASFFAGNFVNWDYVESVDSSKNVMNSNADKLSAMDEFWGAEFVEKIQTVIDTLTATLVSDKFYEVADNARNQLVDNDLFYNSTWPIVAAVVLLGLCALFCLLHYRKLKKNEVLGSGEARPQKRMFEKPAAEDIFDFDDKHKM